MAVRAFEAYIADEKQEILLDSDNSQVQNQASLEEGFPKGSSRLASSIGFHLLNGWLIHNGMRDMNDHLGLANDMIRAR